MQKVFISYKFRDSDREIANSIKQLVESHLLTPLTGENLGGGVLYPEVKELIEKSDALIAFFLLPLDVELYDWIKTEYNYACAMKKRAVVVVENGMPWSNPENREYVALDRNKPLPAFLKLSSILGLWRAKAGRPVSIRLLPDNIARLLFKKTNPYACRYRLLERSNPISDWQIATPAELDRGIVFDAIGVRDELSIQVQVTGAGGASYSSPAIPQIIPIDLKEES